MSRSDPAHAHEADPRWAEFHEKLRVLITEYKQVLEPGTDDVDADELDLVGKMLPNRIVLVVSWLDDDGDEWLARISESMPGYAWRGMLHSILS